MFDGAGLPPKSAREIAARIKPGMRLSAAEDELRAIKSRIGEIGEEIRQLAGAGDASNDRRLIALEKERTGLLAKVQPLRRSVIELRAGHAARVAEALTPLVKTAAASAHSAALELRAALAAVDEINIALTSSHAEGVWLPAPLGLDATVERAARLAGRG